MAEINTGIKDKVPFLQKAAFGSGHLVNNLMPGALAIFMFFLLTAFGMDPFLAGLLGGLPRLVDAISDPIMGYISDNTNTRLGGGDLIFLLVPSLQVSYLYCFGRWMRITRQLITFGTS
jgi:Na+/melibiose symporter-like transporter